MNDDPTEDADRLEHALERIAALATRRPQAAPATGNSEIAARLDSLIAQLRATLSHTGA
jgi:hypothetical protein